MIIKGCLPIPVLAGNDIQPFLFLSDFQNLHGNNRLITAHNMFGTEKDGFATAVM